MSLEKEKTLNALKRKKRIGIALIIVLTLAFGGFLTWRVDNVASRYEMESRTMGMRVLDDMIVHELMATRDLKENYALKAELNGIETVYNTKLLIFSASDNGAGQHMVLYSSQDLPGYETAEEYGIKEEMTANVHEADEVTADMLMREAKGIVIDGIPYFIFLQKRTDSSLREGMIFAYIIPVLKTSLIMIEQMLIISLVFLIIAIVLFVWIYATIKLVFDHSLNNEQREMLGRKKIIRRIGNGISIGGIIILIFALLFIALSRLFTVYQQVDNSFSVLAQRIKDNKDQEESAIALNKEKYTNYATEIAKDITANPGRAGSSYLQNRCDEIGADYIILFDENGDEYVSNAGFVGLSLETDASASTYEFRRLLNGVPSILHDLDTDELTGRTSVLVGVRMGKPEYTGHYKALLMSVPSGVIYAGAEKDVGTIMSELVYDGMEAFAVDPETREIIAASDDSLVGKNATALGLEEKVLTGGYKDCFSFNGRQYYGKCEEIDGILYYYASEGAEIWKNIIGYVLSVVAIYFILIMILVVYMMYGYEKFFEIWSNIGDELKAVNTLRDKDGREKISIDPSKRWKTYTSDYGALAPIHEAKRVLNIALVISIAALTIVLGSDYAEVFSPMITYVLHGTWSKGWNLFSFTNIFIMACEIFAVATVLNFIITLSINLMGTKGETIGRLLLSLVKYASIILFIYMMMLNLGFDPRTLLASLGLITFAVSLGAQELIKDILAGLSMVFEGEYQVGDIIEVGGFRGKVLEVGVRTTKLEGRGGNILIIGNSNVSNVVNMTRMNSWYPLELRFAGGASFPATEELLIKELPTIGANIPEIISGPIYKGIIGLSGDVVTVSIISECDESDIHKVERSLNKEIREMLEKNGIKLL